MSKIVKAIIGVFIFLLGVLLLVKGTFYFASYGSNPVIETQYYTITGLGASGIICVVGTIMSSIGWVIFWKSVREKLRK